MDKAIQATTNQKNDVARSDLIHLGHPGNEYKNVHAMTIVRNRLLIMIEADECIGH